MSINHNHFNDEIKILRKKAEGLSVLYVEDDPLIRSEYIKFLSKIFDSIQSAENGQIGLEMALEKHFDLVIADVQMPFLDGLGMIEKIKEIYPEQASLLISAHQESAILHRSVELNIDGYIFKPIDRDHTIRALMKIVSKIVLIKENILYKEQLEELVTIKSNEVIESYMTDKLSGLYSLSKLEKDILIYPNSSLGLLKIKKFKNINDLYGYEYGNSLLNQTGDFLKNMAKKELSIKNCRLYRLSGAHFAILSKLEGDELKDFVSLIIQKFESTEFYIDNHSMYLEMNAGIVKSGDTLSLSHADYALRQSEKEGELVVYQENLSIAKKRFKMLYCKSRIKRALKENQFVPFYQPIIDNATQKIIKYEALARIVLPDSNEILSPGSFLPISKQTKMYNSITQMIIQKALHDFRDSECMVSVNISIDDIRHKPTYDFIFQQISIFPEPKRIIFELLESENIDSYEEVETFFSKLKKFGCRVAIDDFGSGYSNFEHLANLNIDYIKIDGSLIMNVDKTILSHTIVDMIAGFALKLGIKTIAEFVSNDSIYKHVSKLGIDESQGYFFGQPIPFNESMKYIQPCTPLNLS